MRARLEGIHDAAMVMLHGRFGEVPPDMLAALSQASGDSLLDVLAHVDTETLDRLRARMGI